MFKRTLFFALTLSNIMLSSCKEDDSRSCTTCVSDQTPSFELCRESNGNAAVNGEDTGTDYDLYLQGLEEVGTTCGG